MSEGQLGASVTDDRRVERERRRVFEAVGKFLFEHSLDPIPANYMLVHMLVTGSNASAIAAIEEATGDGPRLTQDRSEEHTSELQSLMRISYAVFCLKKNKKEKILTTQNS